MGTASSSVPCGPCRLCCFKQDVVRSAGDDAGLDWITVTLFGVGRVQTLLKKADGACVYLGDQGCTIYENRPKVCRDFDCREHYYKPAAERLRVEAKMPEYDLQIVARGRQLVETARR